MRESPRTIADMKRIKLKRLIDYLERRTPHIKEELWLLFHKMSLKQLIILNEGIVE